MNNSNRMTLRLMRVDPVKYATIAAILTIAMFLIVVLPFFLLFSAIGMSQDLGAGAAIMGGGIFGMLIGMIFYAVFVFIFTLIITAFLNFILKKVNGIDIDFEKAGLGISEIGNQDRIGQ